MIVGDEDSHCSASHVQPYLIVGLEAIVVDFEHLNL
jgi:hypothetical protein